MAVDRAKKKIVVHVKGLVNADSLVVMEGVVYEENRCTPDNPDINDGSFDDFPLFTRDAPTGLNLPPGCEATEEGFPNCFYCRCC